MMSKFWEGLGGKLGEQWVATVLTPAFLFWAAGFCLWLLHAGDDAVKNVIAQFNQYPPLTQGLLAVGCLLGVAISSVVVQRLDLTMLRFLEGYWPRWLLWLFQRPIKRKNEQLKEVRNAWNRLSYKQLKQGEQALSAEEKRQLVELDTQLHRVPVMPDDYMPTKLGDILRAAENRSYEKYGLEVITCWPRLWLLLPENARKELTDARTALDTASRIFLWGLLFLAWVIWIWWLPPLITLLVTFWAYRWALSAAAVYGDLLESAFDLYRFSLYETLRLPLPKNSRREKDAGKELTNYLFRGRLDGAPLGNEPPLVFLHPKKD